MKIRPAAVVFATVLSGLMVARVLAAEPVVGDAKAGQKKNLKQFMAENHIGSYTTLQKWEKITGFYEEVLRRKNDYIAQEKLEMLEFKLKPS